jgi:putative phosphotransacetylase
LRQGFSSLFVTSGGAGSGAVVGEGGEFSARGHVVHEASARRFRMKNRNHYVIQQIFGVLQWWCMSRPIPVEVVPSHVHLSEAHHRILFGERHSGTVHQELSQAGQFAYAETVDVIGPNGEAVALRVLGPSRKATQVELTPTEAAFLGLNAVEAPSGDLRLAVDCVLKTPYATIDASKSVIIPRAHVHLSDAEAQALRLEHGATVRVDVVGEGVQMIERVLVRVHPTYRARMHVHADGARALWLNAGTHIRIRDIQHTL